MKTNSVTKRAWTTYFLNAIFFSLILIVSGKNVMADGSPIDQESDGTLTLPAALAKITGSMQLEAEDDGRSVGSWANQSDYISWPIMVTKTGKYRVEMAYSEDPSCPGNILSLSCGNEKIEIKPRVTDSWATFRTVKIGEMSLGDLGPTEVFLKVVHKASSNVIDLKRITLVPVDKPSTAEEMLPAVQPDASGGFLLKATDVQIMGADAKIEGGNNVGSWTDASTYLWWRINVTKAGRYHVSWSYSTGPGAGGSDMIIKVGDRPPLRSTPDLTTGWDDYKSSDLGNVTFDTPGTMDLTVKTYEANGGYVMNIKSIKIVPLGTDTGSPGR